MTGLLKALLVHAGYWFRPYDMLADRRRWFWQPSTRCGGVIYIGEPDPSVRPVHQQGAEQ